MKLSETSDVFLLISSGVHLLSVYFYFKEFVMKKSLTLIVAGLLVSAVSNVSFAGCAASCVNCRYEAAGNYFYCGDAAVKGVRPRVAASAQPSGGNVKSGSPVSTNARTSDPTVEPRAPAKSKSEVSIETLGVTSPRDSASGLPAAKRQHPPINKATP